MDLAGGDQLLTSAEYHELGRAGVLSEDDRVELIEGKVVPMAPIGPRHAGCANYLSSLLARWLGTRVIVTAQNPVLRRPTSLGFAEVAVHHRGDRIAFEAFPDLQIEVADVLGDRP
jgi:Uma2 family endonuclease